jgi:multidrug transporter EmrE-like cation transporter
MWPQIIALTLLLVAVEVAAELLLRPPNKSSKYGWRFVLGVLLYMVVAAVFGYVLRLKDQALAVINTLWQALNICIVFVVGVVLLKEKVKPLQVAGAVGAFFCAVLMVVPELSA